MERDSILVNGADPVVQIPQRIDKETETDDQYIKNEQASLIDEVTDSFSSQEKLQNEIIEKITQQRDLDNYRLEEIYNKLDNRDKILAAQINKIKKSMTRLSYELDVTTGKRKKMRHPPHEELKGTDNIISLNQKLSDIKKPASQRLKFKPQSHKPPSIEIDKLEQLTQMEIDLYYKPIYPTSSKTIKDGVIKTMYKNGDISLKYQDGTFRIMRNDCENIYFYNGDIEQRFKNGFVVHQYESNGAIEAVLPSKVTFIIFKTGQVEEHDPSGIKTVAFGDGKYMRIYPDGKCEVKYKKNLPKDWPKLDLLD